MAFATTVSSACKKRADLIAARAEPTRSIESIGRTNPFLANSSIIMSQSLSLPTVGSRVLVTFEDPINDLPGTVRKIFQSVNVETQVHGVYCDILFDDNYEEFNFEWDPETCCVLSKEEDEAIKAKMSKYKDGDESHDKADKEDDDKDDESTEIHSSKRKAAPEAMDANKKLKLSNEQDRVIHLTSSGDTDTMEPVVEVVHAEASKKTLQTPDNRVIHLTSSGDASIDSMEPVVDSDIEELDDYQVVAMGRKYKASEVDDKKPAARALMAARKDESMEDGDKKLAACVSDGDKKPAARVPAPSISPAAKARDSPVQSPMPSAMATAPPTKTLAPLVSPGLPSYESAASRLCEVTPKALGSTFASGSETTVRMNPSNQVAPTSAQDLLGGKNERHAESSRGVELQLMRGQALEWNARVMNPTAGSGNKEEDDAKSDASESLSSHGAIESKGEEDEEPIVDEDEDDDDDEYSHEENEDSGEEASQGSDVYDEDYVFVEVDSIGLDFEDEEEEIDESVGADDALAAGGEHAPVATWKRLVRGLFWLVAGVVKLLTVFSVLFTLWFFCCFVGTHYYKTNSQMVHEAIARAQETLASMEESAKSSGKLQWPW